MWREITHGESYIVWINVQVIQNAAGYATKYLTKAFDVAPYEENERRYSFSKHKEFSKMIQINHEGLPILGDFWEIIGNHRHKVYDGTFELEYHPGDYKPLRKEEHVKQLGGSYRSSTSKKSKQIVERIRYLEAERKKNSRCSPKTS